MRDKKRLLKLSLEQIHQNRKSYIFVCVSITLCMLILIFVYNIYNSLNINKYVSKFVKTDYTIASDDYYDMVYDENSKRVNEELIQYIENKEGFIEGGRIYYYTEREKGFMDSGEEAEQMIEGLYNQDGYAYVDLYGVDKFICDNMKVYKGTIDYNILAEGNHILYGVDTDDYGNVENMMHDVGEKVTLYINNEKREYEIMAIVKKESEINTVRYWSKLYTMYLPSTEYITTTNNTGVMSYLFNVEDAAMEEMEQYLQKYTEEKNDYKYTSKQVYMDEFADMQFMVQIVGIFLTAVLGVIGIVNFCNVVITGMISRKKELAVMQAIGMTRTQMFFMLIAETTAYFFTSVMATVVIGSILSLTVLKAVINSIWFFTYRFSLYPIIIIAPVILLFSFIIPTLTYEIMGKKSVVERMKSTY